jgi:hypothetical protein
MFGELLERLGIDLTEKTARFTAGFPPVHGGRSDPELGSQTAPGKTDSFPKPTPLVRRRKRRRCPESIPHLNLRWSASRLFSEQVTRSLSDRKATRGTCV